MGCSINAGDGDIGGGHRDDFGITAIMNPYEAPKAKMAPAIELAAPSVKFPYPLLVRWILAAILVAVGFSSLINLALAWNYVANSSVFDPAFRPYRWLAIDSCVPVAGILLAMRSRWVYVPIFLHCGLFGRMIYGGMANTLHPSLGLRDLDGRSCCARCLRMVFVHG